MFLLKESESCVKIEKSVWSRDKGVKEIFPEKNAVKSVPSSVECPSSEPPK